jgi:hypothetical protein
LVQITKKPSDMGPPRKFFTRNDAGLKGEVIMNFFEKITGSDMTKEMKTKVEETGIFMRE